MELDLVSPAGLDFWNVGVYDRIVPEAILRLLDRGETAIDIGANVGQDTSMMAWPLEPRARPSRLSPARNPGVS